MCLKKLAAEDVHLTHGAGALVMLAQPGYIVLDIPPEECERPDERFFMTVTEIPEAIAFQDALKKLGTRGYRFYPKREVYCFNGDKCVFEINGPSAYVDKVVTAAQKLGLRNLRA